MSWPMFFRAVEIFIKHLMVITLPCINSNPSKWYLTYRELPSERKIAIIFPFLKPHNIGHLLRDHQPVALTTWICKLFQHMVNFRLMWLLEFKQLLLINQSAYKTALSTTAPLPQ